MDCSIFAVFVHNTFGLWARFTRSWVHNPSASLASLCSVVIRVDDKPLGPSIASYPPPVEAKRTLSGPAVVDIHTSEQICQLHVKRCDVQQWYIHVRRKSRSIVFVCDGASNRGVRYLHQLEDNGSFGKLFDDIITVWSKSEHCYALSYRPCLLRLNTSQHPTVLWVRHSLRSFCSRHLWCRSLPSVVWLATPRPEGRGSTRQSRVSLAPFGRSVRPPASLTPLDMRRTSTGRLSAAPWWLVLR